MFFDLELLCRQRKGKFAAIWIAATRGLTHMKKAEIESVNITRICDEILRYVMSRSRLPRERLSLYLSAQLIYGTVLIYRQQVNNLQSTTAYFSFYIKRPVYKFVNDDDEGDTGKKKSKRTTKAKTTTKRINGVEPENKVDERSAMEQLLHTEPNVNVTDIIHISLPEEVSTRIEIREQELFGDEGQIENQLQQLQDVPWPMIPQEEPQPVLPTVEPKVTAPTDKRQIASVEDVAQSPSKRRRTESVATVRLPAEVDRALMPPPQPPRPTTLTDAEIIENLNQPRLTTPPRAKRVRSLNFDNVLTPSRHREINILNDSPFLYTIRDGNMILENRMSPIPIRTRNLDPFDIVQEILRDVRCEKEDMISVIRDVEKEKSLQVDSRIQPIRSPNVTELQRTLDPGSVAEISVPAEIRPSSIENLLEEVNFPSPRLSRIPSILPESSDPSKHFPRIHTSTPTGIDTEAKRQTALLNRIRDIFRDLGNEPITLEHICKPLTRVTVAGTFNALLHLHAKRCIILRNHPETLELQDILPGPQLLL